MSRKQKEQEHPVLLSKRNAQLAQLGARVLEIVRKHDDASAAGLITNTEQRLRTTQDVIRAAQELGLMSTYAEGE